MKALHDMIKEFTEIEKNLDEDDPNQNGFDDFVSFWGVELFDGTILQDANVDNGTYALILEEYRKSKLDRGPFGNSSSLQVFDFAYYMELCGFFHSPFISEDILQDFFSLAREDDLYLNMTSIAVSPILSTQKLHELVDGLWGSSADGSLLWINLAILINANSDIYVLNGLGSNSAEDLAICYCNLPSVGDDVYEYGVCGSLSGMFWFTPPEVFDAWTSEDLIGELEEDEDECPGKEVLSNLIEIARQYLRTSEGKKENSREKLRQSETFGKLLVAFRMIQEFKYARARVEDEIKSESDLVRSVLYWKPGLDSALRRELLEKGLCFPEEIGELLVNGWNKNLNLIF